jgi:serine/threonine protein kinase
MSNGTGEALIEVIEKSGLIPPAVLARVIGELKSSGIDAYADGDRLLEHLVSRELLTPWQAGKIRRRKHKGFLLGNYKLLRHLGTGGMSSVYLAEHVHMKQLRALKVLPPERVTDASYLARFYREARAAAALDHPNIVHAYDIARDGDTHFLVVEYIDGFDLQKLVATKGPLSFASAIHVVRQTAAGLAHAHDVGVVHRDIKPANLFVDSEGTVKILDMGLARFTTEEMEQQMSLTQMHDEQVLGTTNYLSPEQALNSHAVDGRADIYSLGCTFYFLLTGSPPFSTGTVAQRLMMHLNQKPEPISSKRRGVPPELEAIFDKMTAKKPKHRYQSAAEVEAIFHQLAERFAQEGADPGFARGTTKKDGSGRRRVKPMGMTFEGTRGAAGETGSMRDTDGGPSEATTARPRPTTDDDELRLADDDDGLRPERMRRPTSPAAKGAAVESNAPAVGRTGGESTRTPTPEEPGGAAGVVARNDDFMAELFRSAESVSRPAHLQTSQPPTPQIRPPMAKPAGHPTAGRDAQSDDEVTVKKDLDRLFSRHPRFAAIVFGMFAVMLVLGLYYMIRSSAEDSAPSTTTGTSRDG